VSCGASELRRVVPVEGSDHLIGRLCPCIVFVNQTVIEILNVKRYREIFSLSHIAQGLSRKVVIKYALLATECGVLIVSADLDCAFHIRVNEYDRYTLSDIGNIL
jgi:hypothetical protein